jgi:hypothetical protein
VFLTGSKTFSSLLPSQFCLKPIALDLLHQQDKASLPTQPGRYLDFG